MNRKKIILCGRKDYESYHKPKGLVGAYLNDKSFVKSLPENKVMLCGKNVLKAIASCKTPKSIKDRMVTVEVKRIGKVSFLPEDKFLF